MTHAQWQRPHRKGSRLSPSVTIHSLSGPIEGGTQVTIEGSNLGTSQEEVYGKIKIGGIPCIPTEYNVFVRVVCRTGANGSPLTADVVVGNRTLASLRRRRSSSTDKSRCSTFNLALDSSREALVSKPADLHEQHLNVGSNLTVYLDSLPCSVDKSQVRILATEAACLVKANMLEALVLDFGVR
ncbi:hypothetical protein HPB51_006955 [Rhipicephalus microplus]|uniref:IPT/TIG domain-containing protein n=1 Tax=Rhipicephalus microplus TaxID=6941 RepID=A0A9J6DT76_RHIMP|nr:hypothetical protein HPB51_006955 [Rhipicephalus microplus]